MQFSSVDINYYYTYRHLRPVCVSLASPLTHATTVRILFLVLDRIVLRLHSVMATSRENQQKPTPKESYFEPMRRRPAIPATLIQSKVFAFNYTGTILFQLKGRALTLSPLSVSSNHRRYESYVRIACHVAIFLC